MISIIIPVFNVEKYLTKCIDSLLLQTYKDFEIIIVDDGTEDSGGAICDGYAQENECITVVHQKNGGLSAARNTGLALSRGEYITFIDSDDYVSNDYLESLIKEINLSGADISACKPHEFTDGEAEPMPQAIAEQEKCFVISGKEACLELYRLQSKIPVTAWAKLIKRSLFYGIKFPEGKIHEDEVVTPRLMYRASKIVMSNRKMYFYRQRPDSIMNQEFSLRRFDAIEGIDDNIRWLTAEGASTELIRAVHKYRKKLNSVFVLMAYKAGMEKQIQKEYRISELRAIWDLKMIVSDELFEWYMKQFHPQISRANSYLVKLKRMIGLKK